MSSPSAAAAASSSSSSIPATPVSATPNRDMYVRSLNETSIKISQAAIAAFFRSLNPAKNDPKSLKERVTTCKEAMSSNHPVTIMGMIQTILAPLTEENFLKTPKDVQSEITQLEARTKRVFWIVVMNVYAQLETEKVFNPILLSCQLAHRGDSHINASAHVDVIGAIALPIIRQLVKTLDAFNPSILDEAKCNPDEGSTEGIHQNVISFFAKFGKQI